MVALAAVTCGRLSAAETVRAGRGQASASADQYRVSVTEPGLRAPGGKRRVGQETPEVVLEHWGGDAELLRLRSSLSGVAGLPGPVERARIAASTMTYYDLDSLQVEYPDGAELVAGRETVVLYGPRQGRLRKRDRLLRASLRELL